MRLPLREVEDAPTHLAPRLVTRGKRFASACERALRVFELLGKLRVLLDQHRLLRFELIDGAHLFGRDCVGRAGEARDERAHGRADRVKRGTQCLHARYSGDRPRDLACERSKILARHARVRLARVPRAVLLRRRERALDAAELARERGAPGTHALDLLLGAAHDVEPRRAARVGSRLFFDSRQRGGRLGEPLGGSAALGLYPRPLRREIRVFGREVRARARDELCAERLGALKPLHLPLEEAQVRRELSSKRMHLAQVLFRLPELLERLFFLEFVRLQTERVFEEHATVARRGEEDAVGLALRDDVVARLAHVRAREELGHVAQTHARAVDRVLARAVSVHRALDHHLVEVDLERARAVAAGGHVVEDDRHRRAARARHQMRAAPDEVFGPAAAHGLHRLLAERETERLGDVRLPRPVRPHDGGRRAREVEHGLLRERLEPRDL